MRTATTLLMVGITMLAFPNASADACDGNPSAVVEECHSFGQTGGEMNAPDVQTTGCIIDINGQCVPTGATLQDGAGIGIWRATTVYVGVDVNLKACQYIASCSVSYDTGTLTYKVVETVL